MVTFRTILTAGAALIALMAAVPAQAQRAPLQLVPQADEVRMTAHSPSSKVAKTRKAAKTTTNARKAQPTAQRATRNTAAKAARNSAAKKTANTASNQRPARAVANAQRARAAVSTRGAVAVADAQTAVPASDLPAMQATGLASDNIMRGSDTVSLVARLPWWRNDRMQPIRYGSAEAESKVLAAADAWIASNPSTNEPANETFAQASPEEAETIVVADAGEPNDIDLAAASVPAPPSPTFLQSLLALLGGAAAAAASARFLFV